MTYPEHRRELEEARAHAVREAKTMLAVWLGGQKFGPPEPTTIGEERAYRAGWDAAIAAVLRQIGAPP